MTTVVDYDVAMEIAAQAGVQRQLVRQRYTCTKVTENLREVG